MRSRSGYQAVLQGMAERAYTQSYRAEFERLCAAYAAPGIAPIAFWSALAHRAGQAARQAVITGMPARLSSNLDTCSVVGSEPRWSAAEGRR